MSGTANIKLVTLFAHECRAASKAFKAVVDADKNKDITEEEKKAMYIKAYRLAAVALYNITDDSHVKVIELTEDDIISMGREVQR